MEEVTAIFDIGKTNKKLVLFDRSFQVVDEVDQRLPEIIDDDGYPCEDVAGLVDWMSNSLREVLHQHRWTIKRLNFSAYGASFVHLNTEGKVEGFLYNYLKPLPEEIQESFYRKYGPKLEISTATASPALGMLNSGLQLYWLKEKKPEMFRNIQTSLHLPQYCSYTLSSRASSEITSIGCHTYLWDYQAGQYHQWVVDEGLTNRFPPIVPTDDWQILEIEGQNIDCGFGIHDSSSALVPYVKTIEEPFALLSTGTWNITLNPFNPEPLTESELKKDCLNYINHAGNPVKAARVFLGNEYDFQQNRIAKHFGVDPDYHSRIRTDPTLIRNLINKQPKGARFYPQTMEGTGPFPQKFDDTTDLSQFDSFQEAYHQLMLDLVAIQVHSTRLVLGSAKKIFVSGGFVNNQVFLDLLASMLPEVQVLSSSISRASALGAAMVINRELPGNQILEAHPHSPLSGIELARYQPFPSSPPES